MLASGAVVVRTPLNRVPMRNRSNAINAPDPIQPTGTMTTDQAWAALERSRANLFAAIDNAKGRDLKAVVRQHPVLGPLDGYQWIAAVGGHEERHALQIIEIAEQLQDAGN